VTTVTFAAPLYPRAGESPVELTDRLALAIDALGAGSARRHEGAL